MTFTKYILIISHTQRLIQQRKNRIDNDREQNARHHRGCRVASYTFSASADLHAAQAADDGDDKPKENTLENSTENNESF